MAECRLIYDVTHNPELGCGAKDRFVHFVRWVLCDDEGCLFEIVSTKAAPIPHNLAPVMQVSNAVSQFFCYDLDGRSSPQQAFDLLFALVSAANHDTAFAGKFQE
jgi:hypothetical protein